MIITVAGLLVKNNKILLGKRQPDRLYYPGVWDMPGGRCEAGETPEQALARELQEEIGVTPTRFEYIESFSDPNAPGGYEYRIYAVGEWAGTPENLHVYEHSEIQWSTIDEAKRLPLPHPRYPEFFSYAMSLFRE